MLDTQRRLGRGLENLIPRTLIASGKNITQIPIQLIKANPFQPRLEFDKEALERLSESIKTHGLNQPILVRKINNDYQLIAGERRLRASILAGLDSIPAIVRDVSDEQSLQLALIENLDRENLNPIEEAKGYQRLINEFEYTQQKLAELFGKQRSTIANTLRLLRLPAPIQQAISSGKLSEGHARALLSLESESAILAAFQKVLQENLSVRETETLTAMAKPQKQAKNTYKQDPILKELSQKLEKHFDLNVKVRGSINRGAITISYKNKQELQNLLERL